MQSIFHACGKKQKWSIGEQYYFWSSKRPESTKNRSVWFKINFLSVRVCLSRSADFKKLNIPKRDAQLRLAFNFFKIGPTESNNTFLWGWNLWQVRRKWDVLSGQPQWAQCGDDVSVRYCECSATLEEPSLKDLRFSSLGDQLKELRGHSTI